MKVCCRRRCWYKGNSVVAMKPRIYWAFYLILVSLVKAGHAQEIAARRHDDFDFKAGARTFLFGKLVLVPVLAALGLKFLALLPIVLAKIVLLSAMNFLSTNLNLIISTLFGLKNFLGKYGLWAQEDTTTHPELQTFAELANQPILQPSFRYEYVVDKGLNKSPSFTKVFNGFVPSESDLNPYKWNTFDRRTRTYDKRYIPKAKEPTTGGSGKYKCYWTNDGSGGGLKLGTDIIEHSEVMLNRRQFNEADHPQVQYDGFAQQDLYEDSNAKINPPPELQAPQSTFEPYQTINEADRQVATRTSAAANPGDSSNAQPFTSHINEVKVPENYRVDENQPLVYLLQQQVEAAAKFKDDAAKGI